MSIVSWEEYSVNLCGLSGQVHADGFGLILALPGGDLALISRRLAEPFGF